MNNTFSGIVKIADIDDYIAPSQNCIKPILDAQKEQASNTTSNEKTNNKSKVKISLTSEPINISSEEKLDKFDQIERDYTNSLIKLKDKKNKTAKITLNDCLACSGCVTTAETILIEQQSIVEFLKISANPEKTTIVSISPHSIISLANYFKLSNEDTLKKICKIFETFNVKIVFNLEAATRLGLDLTYDEFQSKILNGDDKFLICSECPGWICYAEKKEGDWIIPYMSEIKSPQSIQGYLAKNYVSSNFGIEIKDIYHVTIMPCYDKKLEATRESIFTDYKDTDTVISTVELIDLFAKIETKFNDIDGESQKIYHTYNSLIEKINDKKNKDSSINRLESLKTDYSISKRDLQIFFEVDTYFSSNGYAEFIMKKIVNSENNGDIHNHDIFKSVKDMSKLRIEYKILKNSDMKEINLIDDENDKVLLKFAVFYGFRNIQNILKNLKNKKKNCEYSYIEVMACPGGCLNGGGQMRPTSEMETSKELLKKITDNISTSMKNIESYSQNELKFMKNIFIMFCQEKDSYKVKYKGIDKSQQSALTLKW